MKYTVYLSKKADEQMTAYKKSGDKAKLKSKVLTTQKSQR